MNFWDAAFSLQGMTLLFFAVSLLVAFGFEFINGFHDTANAVTTVIYTRSLPATPAVVYSGIMNFLGVVTAGTGVAYGIVNLLPVELIVDKSGTPAALVMVLSLLLAGVIWNLGTWYLGLPVSSSHTLIGSILGVGLANSLLSGKGIDGVRWSKAGETGMFLFISPLIGFAAAYLLLLLMKWTVRNPILYIPPQGDDRPPKWVRGVLIGTCGGVSFAHGSNDGQKGMGLLVLVLIGFLPFHYALTVEEPNRAPKVLQGVTEIRAACEEASFELPKDVLAQMQTLELELAYKKSFEELPIANKNVADVNKADDPRWKVRMAILKVKDWIDKLVKDKQVPDDLKKKLGTIRTEQLTPVIEYVPLWVKICTAFALGLGTMIGYKRIVITVAEKIGKTHLTYAQGAAAELVAAVTIMGADIAHAPVSTTQVLSSGIAGTMAANGSGIQGGTCKKILLAWALTLPCTTLLAGLMFWLGHMIVG